MKWNPSMKGQQKGQTPLNSCISPFIPSLSFIIFEMLKKMIFSPSAEQPHSRKDNTIVFSTDNIKRTVENLQKKRVLNPAVKS